MSILIISSKNHDKIVALQKEHQQFVADLRTEVAKDQLDAKKIAKLAEQQADILAQIDALNIAD